MLDRISCYPSSSLRIFDWEHVQNGPSGSAHSALNLRFGSGTLRVFLGLCRPRRTGFARVDRRRRRGVGEFSHRRTEDDVGLLLDRGGRSALFPTDDLEIQHLAVRQGERVAGFYIGLDATQV